MMKLKPWLSCFLVHCFLWSYWEDILFTQWFLLVSISLKGFFCRLSPSLLSVYNTDIVCLDSSTHQLCDLL